MYIHIERSEDAKILQQDLDQLQQWEKDWMMSFIPENW